MNNSQSPGGLEGKQPEEKQESKQEEKLVTISYQGKYLEARSGQTVAAALLAHGIKNFGSSRKQAQARGLYCAVGRCYSCVMTVNGRENTRACMTLVEEGMIIEPHSGDVNLRSRSDEV